MSIKPKELKALIKAKGWSQVDLAARWNRSITWVSTLINDPDRAPHYDDAFAGLPQRDLATVKRQQRHIRKPPPKGWTLDQIHPRGRIYEALDNHIVEEGTRLVVVGITVNTSNKGASLVKLRIQGDQDVIEITHDECMARFGDTGLDDGQD